MNKFEEALNSIVAAECRRQLDSDGGTHLSFAVLLAEIVAAEREALKSRKKLVKIGWSAFKKKPDAAEMLKLCKIADGLATQSATAYIKIAAAARWGVLSRMSRPKGGLK